MRICDICRQATERLEVLPVELGHVEVCDPCHHRLLDLLEGCEREVTLLWTKLRQAVEKWKQERSPKQIDTGPLG